MPMRILVTGASGYVGAALVPRLKRDGHSVRGFTRAAGSITAAVDDVVIGDAITGAGLEHALDGVEVAYYLIHSMEGAANGSFESAERASAEHFAETAGAAGVRRIVFLGGLLPQGPPLSRHLRSRLAVEELLLAAVPDSIALRASIVIAARSRSFRFLVRLIERLPVLALPSWRRYRTQPIDGRDMTEFLARAATAPAALSGRAWDIVGPDVLTYEQMIRGIVDLMLVDRPSLSLDLELTPIASALAAAVAGEDRGLIEPLMESLSSDLLARDDDAAGAFGVRRHSFAAAVERALRDWEHDEELVAR